MKILALTNLYPNPFQPHRAVFNRHWLRLLAQRHEVRVISPIAWTDELAARRRGAAPLPAGRRVTLDGLLVDHPRFLFTPRICRGWYGHFYEASVRGTFERVAAELQPDIVHAPWAYPDGWAAVRLARRRGIPAVVQVHGSDVLLLDQFPARRRRTVEAIRAADGLVAVSADIARRLEALGASRRQIRVIYDGIDPEMFHPGNQAEARRRLGIPAEHPALLFIGNLVAVKGLDVLIDACALLSRDNVPVRLFVIGHGPLRSELEKRSRAHGLEGSVHFIGALPQSELADWYRAADLFVLPSRSEGVPNVLLEATACGTPWVARRVGGIPEIAREGLCRLVDSARPAELAQAIRESLAVPRSRNRVAETRNRAAAVDELDRFLAEILAASLPMAAPVGGVEVAS